MESAAAAAARGRRVAAAAAAGEGERGGERGSAARLLGADPGLPWVWPEVLEGYFRDKVEDVAVRTVP